jgi:site-specific recombinase XerD
MLKKKSVVLYYFALLQFENGIRTSELIGVKSGDITATGSFKLHGKKGSSNRMIAPGEARDYLLECRKNGSTPFGDYDRFYLRREYIKVGIYHWFEGDKKGKVTHVFRHLFVSGMLQSGIEVEEAKKFVGHKNVKSTEHYGKIN